MTDDDFRAAVEIEVLRWRFLEMVRELEPVGTPGSDEGRAAAALPGSAARPVLDVRDTAEEANPRPVNEGA